MRGCLISSQNHNKCAVLVLLSTTTSYTSACSLFAIGASRFQSPRSPVMCFFYLHSFIRHVISHNVTPPEFRSSYLSVSTHFHVLITTSSSVVLSALPNHLCFHLCLPRLPLLLPFLRCLCNHNHSFIQFFLHSPYVSATAANVVQYMRTCCWCRY